VIGDQWQREFAWRRCERLDEWSYSERCRVADALAGVQNEDGGPDVSGVLGGSGRPYAASGARGGGACKWKRPRVVRRAREVDRLGGVCAKGALPLSSGHRRVFDGIAGGDSELPESRA